MKFRLSEDKDQVVKIREALRENEGYCPCQLMKTDDTKCICKEFKEHIDDPTYEGYCHCGLYYTMKW